jgi:hypothetical protein
MVQLSNRTMTWYLVRLSNGLKTRWPPIHSITGQICPDIKWSKAPILYKILFVLWAYFMYKLVLLSRPFENKTNMSGFWMVKTKWPPNHSKTQGYTILYIIVFVYDLIICMKWSSLVVHSKTGQICPVFEWLNSKWQTIGYPDIKMYEYWMFPDIGGPVIGCLL